MLIHGTELVVRPEFRTLFDGIRHPGEILRRWNAPLPESNQRSSVTELRLPEGNFHLKVYAYRGRWILRTPFIVARARREYQNLLQLPEFGFRAAVPAAYGQARTLGFLNVSFLLTRTIENAVNLREIADHPGSVSLSPGERRELIEDFARALRRAHDAKFFLHTLRLKNILLAREGDRWMIHLIDVPFAGIWRWRLMPEAGRLHDLRRLLGGARKILGRTERLRFARAYGADRSLVRNLS